MLQHWNERYAQIEYAYGELPNSFLKQELDKLTPGTILFPAEGEGRNAVYAASKGWVSKAFDQSIQGKHKANNLAKSIGVDIDYIVEDIYKLPYIDAEFDVIGLVYAHFPADVKSNFHKHLLRFLKPGGTLIFEAFSKDHLNYSSHNPKVGGPKDIDMLFSLDEIKSDFEGFDIQILEDVEVELSEGLYHNGIGKVIRFVGTKK